MSKKMLLISGCPRSGTTLVNLIMNSHPEIAITNEINLFSIVNNVDDILFRRENKIKKMVELGRSIDRKKTSRETWKANELLNWIPRKKICINNLIYELCSSIKSTEVSIYGDKTPGYYRNDISLLAKDLDIDIYMIHVTRDPFEVVSSIDRRIKNSRQKKDYWTSIMTLEGAINEWIVAWNSRRSLSESDRVKLLDINYNAFIEDPSQGVEIISKFLSTENKFDTSMISNAELDHYIDRNTIINIAPQLQEVLYKWHKYDMLLDGKNSTIPVIPGSYFNKLIKSTHIIAKQLRRILS